MNAYFKQTETHEAFADSYQINTCIGQHDGFERWLNGEGECSCVDVPLDSLFFQRKIRHYPDYLLLITLSP